MWRLIRFALLRWGGQQHGIIDSLPEVHKRGRVPPQISDSHLLIHDSPVFSGVSAISREREGKYAVGVANSRHNFKINEGSVRLNASRHNLRTQIGVIGHDGSYKFWEWDGRALVSLDTLVGV